MKIVIAPEKFKGAPSRAALVAQAGELLGMGLATQHAASPIPSS